MSNSTIVEVAKLAGVSVTTVSRCLNSPEKVGKKTLARVRRVIEEINFSPNMLAQNFRRGKTNIILVVVHEIGSWLFAEILEGIRAVLGTRYSIILTESRPEVNDNNFIEMLVAKQVEGVILLCSTLPFSKKSSRKPADACSLSPIKLSGWRPFIILKLHREARVRWGYSARPRRRRRQMKPDSAAPQCGRRPG